MDANVITIFHPGDEPDTGPDPAFQVNPDPNTDPVTDLDPIRIQGFDD